MKSAVWCTSARAAPPVYTDIRPLILKNWHDRRNEFAARGAVPIRIYHRHYAMNRITLIDCARSNVCRVTAQTRLEHWGINWYHGRDFRWTDNRMEPKPRPVGGICLNYSRSQLLLYAWKRKVVMRTNSSLDEPVVLLNLVSSEQTSGKKPLIYNIIARPRVHKLYTRVRILYTIITQHKRKILC